MGGEHLRSQELILSGKEILRLDVHICTLYWNIYIRFKKYKLIFGTNNTDEKSGKAIDRTSNASTLLR